MFGFKKNNKNISVEKDVAPLKEKKSVKKGFSSFVLKIKKLNSIIPPPVFVNMYFRKISVNLVEFCRKLYNFML